MVKIIWGLCVTSKRNTPDEISFISQIIFSLPFDGYYQGYNGETFYYCTFLDQEPRKQSKKISM